MGGKARAQHQGLAALSVLQWIHRQDTKALKLDRFVEGLAEILIEHGIALARIVSGSLAAHPQVGVHGVSWTPTEGAQMRILSKTMVDADRVQGSPFSELGAGRPSMRYSLAADKSCKGAPPPPTHPPSLHSLSIRSPSIL